MRTKKTRFFQGDFSRLVEGALWLVALVCLCASLAVWRQTHTAEVAAAEIGKIAFAGTNPITNHAETQDVIGKIQIPALHLTAPVTNGVGKLELIRGVGHIPGTAWAGGLGTMALAGHRDTFFRGLRNVSVGMQVRVTDTTGSYEYQIDSTEIVTPDQVEVLEIGSDPSLVLITCYPFNYVGAAPKRFIVHAKLLSVTPDAES